MKTIHKEIQHGSPQILFRYGRRRRHSRHRQRGAGRNAHKRPAKLPRQNFPFEWGYIRGLIQAEQHVA
jgi:hypothetical protein